MSIATGRSESVAESLALYRFSAFGITRIEQQVPIKDDAGRVIARVDFLLPADDGTSVVVEVDGLLKYRVDPANAHSFDPAGADSTDDNPLVREKLREDKIRRLGYPVVRLTWSTLWDVPRLRALLRDAHIRV